MKIIGSIAIAFVRVYQWCVSPWLGTCCRFSPSCSHYAVEAIETHGALKGVWLAARRVLRCHPFAHAGYDPVPPASKNTQSILKIGKAAEASRAQCMINT